MNFKWISKINDVLPTQYGSRELAVQTALQIDSHVNLFTSNVLLSSPLSYNPENEVIIRKTHIYPIYHEVDGIDVLLKRDNDMEFIVRVS